METPLKQKYLSFPQYLCSPNMSLPPYIRQGHGVSSGQWGVKLEGEGGESSLLHFPSTIT